VAKPLMRQLGLAPKRRTPKCWACGKPKTQRKGTKRTSTAKRAAVQPKRYYRWINS
jgi:hypothetical protein